MCDLKNKNEVIQMKIANLTNNNKITKIVEQNLPI